MKRLAIYILSAAFGLAALTSAPAHAGWGAGWQAVEATDMRDSSGRVGILDFNLSAAHPSAVSSPGVVVRRLTTVQRDALSCATFGNGSFVYNTTAGQFQGCVGGAWAAFIGGGGGETLDGTYGLGDNAFTVTDALGSIAITDNQLLASSGAITVTASGVYAGAQDHAGLYYRNAQAPVTANDILGVQIDFTGATNAGAGSLIGVEITMAAAGEDAVTVPLGDVVVTSGDVVVAAGQGDFTRAANAVTLAATNNTATTLGAAAGDGVVEFDSTSLTTGVLLNLELTEGTLAGGYYLRAWDVTAGADVFHVGEDGATVIAGAASGTAALTLTAGDIAVTAGDIDLANGNITVADATVTDPEITVTCVGAMATGCVRVADSHTGADDAFEIETSGNFSGAALNIASTAVHTGDLVRLTLDAAGVDAGAQALQVTNEAGAHLGPLVSVTDVGTNAAGHAVSLVGGNLFAARVLSVGFAATSAATSDGVYVDLVNSSVDSRGLVVDDSGNRAWTDPLVAVSTGTGTGTDSAVEVTFEGDGAQHLVELIGTPDAAHTGYLLKTTFSNADEDAGAILVDITGGDLGAEGIQLDDSGNTIWTGSMVSATTGTAAFTGDAFYVNIEGAGTAAASGLEIDVGAVLYAGSAINVDLGATSTGGQAARLLGGAAARISALVDIQDSTTSTGASARIIRNGNGNGNVLLVSQDGTGNQPVVNVLYGAASTGDAVVVDLVNSDVSAQAFVVDDSGNRAWSQPLVQLSTGTGAGIANAAALLHEGSGATHLLQLASNPAAAGHSGNILNLDADAGGAGDFSGDAVAIDLTGAAATAQGIVITEGGRATSVDVVSITDTGTNAADSLEIAKTGAASTGSNINLTNTVAADAAANKGKVLTSDYNAAAVDAASSLNVFRSHTTGWADAGVNDREVVLIELASAGSAGAGDDYALRIDASGANTEALHVDAGTVQIDEQTTFGVSGVGMGSVGAGGIFVNLGAIESVVFDAAAVPTTETDGIIWLQATTATANVRGMGVDLDLTANVDGVAASFVNLTTAGFAPGAGIVAPNFLYAHATTIEGNNDAAETGAFVGDLFGISAGTLHNNTNVIAVQCEAGFGNGTGGNDACVSSLDSDLVLREYNTAGAASGIGIYAAGGFAASGGAGGPITITAGAGDGAGAGGDLTITAGTAPGAGDTGNLYLLTGIGNGGLSPVFRVRGTDNAGARETWFDIDSTLTPPVRVSNSARPIKWISVNPTAMRSDAGAADVDTNGLPSKTASNAAVGTDIITYTFGVPYDADLTGATDFVVELAWTGTGAPGVGTETVSWVCAAKLLADNGDTAAAFGASTTTGDDLSAANQQERLDCLNIAGVVAGNTVTLQVQRDGAAVADDYASDAFLLHTRIRYTAVTP